MVETCYFCQGTIEQRNIDVDFRWGKKLKMIRSVPAGICRQCGERYFDAGVYKAMEKLARSRRKPAGQVAVDVFEFRTAASAQ
ncbi:MAG: YgiT-type zinc finger protein [Acidobacteria bacterium]|nr:YgiT-type zinc finger protein [Acidobacteriota bacterium]MBI3656802.1 YgiT-type zinc finger protein [Acidobacteriota bacterium]